MLEVHRLAISGIASAGPLSHHRAVLVLPFIDEGLALRAGDVLSRRALADGLLLLVEDDLRLGFIQVANLVYSRSTSEYFGYVAEDAFPGEGWLKCGLYTLDQTGAGLLAFNDGRFYGNLAVFGLVRRTWARRLYRNFLFYPGYKRHFADTELSAISRELGQMTFNENCLLMEVDYDKHAKRNDPQDDALYRERARSGFGGLVAPFDPD